MNNLSSSPVKTDSLSQGTLEQAEMFSPTKPFQSKNASGGTSRTPKPTKTPTITPSNPPFKQIPHGLKHKHDIKVTGRRFSLSPQKSNSVVPQSTRRTPLTAIKQQSTRMAKFDTLKKARANLTGKLMQQKENEFSSSPMRDDATVKLSMEKEREEKEEAEKHGYRSSKINTPKSVASDAIEEGEVNPETSPVRQYQSRLSNKRSHELAGSLSIADAKKSRLQSSPISSTIKTPKRTDGNLKLTFRDREHRQKLVLQPTDQLNHPEASTVLETTNSPLANVSRGSLLEDGNEDEERGETEKDQDLNVNDISLIAANSSINIDQEAEHVVEKPPHSSLDVFAAMMDEQEEEDQGQYFEDHEVAEESVSVSTEEIEKIHNEYKASNEELSKLLEAKNELLQVRLRELAQAEEQLKSLETSYSSLLSEKDNITAENKTYAAQVVSLKNMLNQSRRETGFQNHKIGLKEVRLTKYRDMYRRLFSHAKANEEALYTKGNLLKKFKVQVQLLEDEKRDLISYREKIEKELESVKNDYSEQSKDLYDANEKLSKEIISNESLSQELAQCNSKLSDLSETLEEAQEKSKSLENDFNESQNNVLLLEEKVKDLESVCKELSEELETMKAESKQIIEKSDELTSRLEKAESIKDSLNLKLKDSEEKAQLHFEEKEKLLSEFNAFQISITEDLKSKDEQILMLKAANSELSRSHNEMIESSDADHSSKAQLIDELQSKIKDSESVILKLEEALDEMKSSKTELQGYAEEKERQVAEKNSIITDLETKIDEMSSTASDERVKELTAALEEAQAEIENHQSNVEKRLNELAQDLYIQYSQKHEKKVEIIKKGYETKWSGKVKKLCKENELLQLEVSDLKKKLKIESEEKQRLVETFGSRQ